MPENETDFKLKFDGEINEVDASTLGYSLVNVTSIIKEISEEVAVGQKIEIRVKAVAPGSFLIHLTLQAINDPIFQVSLAGALSYGPSILKTLTELFKLRKLLKGDPPSSTSHDGDDVQITADDNARIVVDKRTYNYYFNRPDVNEALAKTFKALDSDKSITGFEITDADEHPLFEANRGDFAGMALTTSVPRPESQDITEDTYVHVIKPSFDPKLKWDVLYKGNRIPVKLQDKAFQRRIERGEAFAKGDVLAVQIRIHQKLDKVLRTYVNKSFEIIEVREHIPRAEETSLFDSVPVRTALQPGTVTDPRMRRLLRLDEGKTESESPPDPEPKPKT